MNNQAVIQRPIYTSSACWHEVPFEKVQLTYELGRFLDERINIEAFGSGLKGIWFVALIMLPEQKRHTNEIIFHRKTKLLEIFWRMDYEKVMAATLPEFKDYLASFFIEVLYVASERKKIKEFDMVGFFETLAKTIMDWSSIEKSIPQAQ